jgi:acetyltransferase-like isoleucine patch superfamily enzyme
MHRVGEFVRRPYLKNIYNHFIDPLFLGPLKFREWKSALETDSVYFSRFPAELGMVSVGFGSRAASVIDVSNANKKTNITIGKYVEIGKNLKILDTFGHDMDAVSQANFYIAFGKDVPEEEITNLGPIVIGNDVGIAEDVTIMGNTVIHDGTVIGTKSLVSGEIPPYCLYGGVPAKLLRPRIDKELATRLQRIAWWDLPPEVVWENRKLLRSNNVADALPKLEELAKKYRKSP